MINTDLTTGVYHHCQLTYDVSRRLSVRLIVGRLIQWGAFTSVTVDLNAAKRFTNKANGNESRL
jgi:hypothetical protein